VNRAWAHNARASRRRRRDVADEPFDQHLENVGGVDEVDRAGVNRRPLVDRIDHERPSGAGTRG
jgi:hypothetical protein